MSLRAFKIGIGVAGTVVVAFAFAIAAVAFRGEDTRNIIERSACAQDPAGQECQTINQDTCIPFRLVMTREALAEFTRCRTFE